MAEIRDIKPADPLWPKRRTDRIQPDSEQETPRPAPRRPRRRRPDDDGDDGSKGAQIDEYA